MRLVLLLCLQAADGPQEGIDAASAIFDRACREYEESLVELGPAAVASLSKRAESLDDFRGRVARRAVDRIRGEQKKLENLIGDLGANEIDVRERATLELMKIGRPARSYLASASRSQDPEVAERAKILLHRLRCVGSTRARWAAIVEEETQQVARLEKRVEQGVATARDLSDAKRKLLRARCKAGRLALPEFLKQEHEAAVAEMQRVQNLYEKAVVTGRDLLRAQIAVSFLEVRLGKASEADLQALQWKAAAQIRALSGKGVLSSEQYRKEIDEIMSDPYEDMAEEKP